MTKLVVAIPCYNEGGSIAKVVTSVPRTFADITEVEVLVVDDGSTDMTADTARDAGALVVSHGRNLGLGAAFRTSLQHCMARNADLLVTIDGDGQFDPEKIESLLEPIVAGRAGFVTASRFKDDSLIPEGISRAKFYGNKIYAKLISLLCGVAFHDVSCGFRAYSRDAIFALNLHGRFTYTQEVFLDLCQKGFVAEEVPVRVKYFPDRKSFISGNLLRYAVQTIIIIARTYRDYKPLRFFWAISLACFGFAVPLASIFLIHYLATGRFYGQLWSGFTAGFLLLVSAFFFVSGLVADSLGTIKGNQERVIALLKDIRYARPKP